MVNSFYTKDEIRALEFKSIGENVLISRFARFYGAESMEIGSNVRIDDFCLLSGIIKLENYIHISAYSALYGRYGIEMADYSGLSPRCTLFSATDDFSGNYMIGPMIDTRYTNVTGAKISIGRFSQVGCNCVILPGATVGEGVAIGAMSLITNSLDDWKVYAGIPAKFLKERSRDLLSFISDGK